MIKYVLFDNLINSIIVFFAKPSMGQKQEKISNVYANYTEK
jgi:hypothetical protein